MEMSSVRRFLPHAGEEKYQMLELNRRLESYLGHVKLLEEENQLLRGEIQALQRNRDNTDQKQAKEVALNLARREVQVAWMEKDRVDLEVSNLIEEMEVLNAQRQKVRAAEAEAKRKLAESMKKLEDEWRAQIWLKEQASHLEQEVMLQVQVYQEEMTSLKSQSALTRPVLMPPQHTQTISLQGLGEEYSQRAAQAWQEAAGVYQRKVEQLEDSLNQARAHMAQINNEKKENQLYVQDLAKEVKSTNAKRELLEKNMAQQRNTHNQELQQLQAQMEALESDKVQLSGEIDNLVVDTRKLLQMKMCLGLEVATYRALLDTESTRVRNQPTSKTSTRTVSLFEVLPKSHGAHPSPQTVSASSQLSSSLTPHSRSISHSKASLMTKIPSWSMTQNTHETLKKVPKNQDENNGIREETIQLETISTAISPRSVCLMPEEEVSYVPAVSASVVPPTVDETDSISRAHVKEDLQDDLTENQLKAGQDTSGTDEAALISLPAGNLSSHPQTPEREEPSHLHADDANGSEDGEEEETEVSTEMAQISHAPMFAWEENDTAIPEERDIVSELELESEDISENYTLEDCRDTVITDLKQLGENTENIASPLFEQASLSSIDVFSLVEEKNEMLTSADVFNVSEIETHNYLLETGKESVEEWQRMDQTEEVKDGEETDKENDLVQKQEEISDSQDWSPSFLTESIKEQHAFPIKQPSNSGDVFKVSKIETLNSLLETEKVSVEEWQRMDQTEEVKDESEVGCGSTEENEGHENVELEDEEDKSDPKTENRNVEERKEEEKTFQDEEESMKDEDIAVMYESFANTGKEAMVKESSASEIDADLHSYLKSSEEKAELMIETHDKDPLLVEDYAEEHIQSDEEESFNISASWRTDPDEADSYALDNTLADTRPLIHYRSDEETDANTQASHMGMSDSEDEREKHEGVLMWGQNTSKRFDTMEDLSEEPEMASIDDVVMEDSAQTLVEEITKEVIAEESPEPAGEDLLLSDSDIDININIKKDNTIMDLSENDLKNCEESNRGEETDKEIDQVQKQEEMSDSQDWGQSFFTESRDIQEQHAFPCEQPSISEDDTGITKEKFETDLLAQIESEREDKERVKTDFDHFPLVKDTPLPEPFQEQALAKEAGDFPQTVTTHSVLIPSETSLTEEQVCAKENDDEQSNVSMLSHAEFTDNLSLNSGPNSWSGSQTNIANSDAEASNSSEDESPNVSQCSQLYSHAGISTELLDINSTTVEASKNDSVSTTALLEEVRKERFEEDSFEHHKALQTVEWEKNKDEQKLTVSKNNTGMDENGSSLSRIQQWEDLDHLDIITGASHNTLSTMEEPSYMTTENQITSEKMDSFQEDVLNEEAQTKEKENDLHSFFSSSIKEDHWRSNFEMAATYDSNEPAETERFSPDTIHPNQSMTLTGHWEEMGSLISANGKHKNEMSMPTAQCEEKEEEEEREEQKIPKAKQLQFGDAKDGQVETAQSDDSIDDGDSWSSGEE